MDAPLTRSSIALEEEPQDSLLASIVSNNLNIDERVMDLMEPA